ncbi:UDP-glucose/GDP-mannose dehydrogenase family protein [Pseudohalioglobus sediminis]|uniref:UDP-glucose 6-dehydrogenase n=1 Tax=Pseudohalioglobus sediminis TaxID=2606449 RepID=A0A5B0X036_9GAMM|nr:UDP-glucose/GDP-mannose dehydrogenase family protein [Pseudohalioglobus sediminis]KAA1191937.1 UDP-glucose/GDP-mannose dehydrogenase family protein [Pseudohalioglobus sediminis]
MKISIFGTGYVGLVKAAIFADVGHLVVCVDKNAGLVARLQRADIPFFEPGLEALVRSGMDNGLLSFTTDTPRAVRDSDFLFICVSPPARGDGSVDLREVEQVALDIATHMQERKLVITASTVPVGTTERLRKLIRSELVIRGSDLSVDVACVPEFLEEGSAVADSQGPDNIIIGADSPAVLEELRRLYQAFRRNLDNIVTMDARSAEFTKFACSAMLATRISLMNEVSDIAEAVGADIEAVRHGVGSDPRIGYQHIYPSSDYGGSRFPRVVRALRDFGREEGQRVDILTAVQDCNQRHKSKLPERLIGLFGFDLSQKVIALWGLSFTPNTDDMRDAASRYVMEWVWSCNGTVRAYDPRAMKACRALYGKRDDLVLTLTKEHALEGADALVICTDWQAFHSPDFELIKSTMNTPLIIDGSNLYDPADMHRLGISYYGIGHGLSLIH